MHAAGSLSSNVVRVAGRGIIFRRRPCDVYSPRINLITAHNYIASVQGATHAMY